MTTTGPIRATHLNDAILRVSYGEVVLFDYHYRPDTPKSHCRRPYMHPLRNLAGDVVTNHRPVDHPWHQGLSLTLSSVNGINFWGGPTYRATTGKYENLDNVGAQRHAAWLKDATLGNGWSGTESLDWIGPRNEPVFTEIRTLTVCDIDPAVGLWRLVWESELTNVRGQRITHNSYCSGEGLKGSGYTGLFLRLSRGFERTPSHIFAPGEMPAWDDYHDGKTVLKSADELNGWKSSRLAYQGMFDTSLNGCLLLCEDLTERPPYALTWFCRPQFPCLAWSTAFDEPLIIEADATIRFRHSLSLVMGQWTKDRASALWLGRPRD